MYSNHISPSFIFGYSYLAFASLEECLALMRQKDDTLIQCPLISVLTYTYPK